MSTSVVTPCRHMQRDEDVKPCNLEVGAMQSTSMLYIQESPLEDCEQLKAWSHEWEDEHQKQQGAGWRLLFLPLSGLWYAKAQVSLTTMLMSCCMHDDTHKDQGVQGSLAQCCGGDHVELRVGGLQGAQGSDQHNVPFI
jgi:hypothetical protein